jgi:hypothetical protein
MTPSGFPCEPSEADAQALGIGFVSTGLHRGRIAIALRWPSGEIAGYGSVEGGTNKTAKQIYLAQGSCSQTSLKKPRANAGLFSYLPVPLSRGRVVLLLGPSVDVPGVLPTPCLLLAPPLAPVPVVPCMPVVEEVEPVAEEFPPFVPLELAPDVLPAAPPAPPPAPPPCASAKVLDRAKTVANAIVVSFMVMFPLV